MSRLSSISFFSLIIGLALCAAPSEIRSQQNVRSLTVLLSGDTYGYFDITPVGFAMAGGVVRRKTAVDHIRTRSGADNILLLDNGNALGYYYLLRGDRGETMVEAMKDLGYDAMTVGRYDFDYGRSTLASYADSASGLAIVCANILDKKTSKPYLRPFVIVNKARGLRIAILGLTDPNIEQHALRKNIDGLAFSDPIETARSYVPTLRKQADLLIVLSHLETSLCSRLASEVPGIDVIVARAHPDRAGALTRMEYLGKQGATVIVQPERYGSTLTNLGVSIDPAAKRVAASLQELVPIDASVTADLTFANRLSIAAEQQYYNYVLSTFNAEPDEPLFLIDDEFTNDDLTKSVLRALLQKTASEAAILNSSLFRFEGIEFPRYEEDPRFRKVTIRSLEQIIQNAELVIMSLTGQQLASLQRLSAANTPRGGGLLHLQVTSQRPEDWYIHNASPVQKSPPEYYRVVTTSYLAGGGDGYGEFRSAKLSGNRFVGAELLKESVDGRPIVISDLLIGHFRRIAGTGLQPSVSAALADTTYLERPLWRFSVSRLQLNYSAGRYRGNSDYQNVGLTELRASDFTRITLESDLRLRQDSRLFIWDNRLYGVLGQSKVTDQPLQEIADDLFFETVLSLRPRSFGNGITLFPSGSFRYDTEFTATERKETIGAQTVTARNPRQQDITIGIGVGVSDMAGFSRTRLSFTQTFDRSKTPRPDENGINLQTMYQAPFFSSLFRSELDGTYYIKHKNSTGDTRRLLVQWKSDLSIPIGSFFIAPSLNVFLFQGQNSSIAGKSPRIATAVAVGITLGYSRDWKIQYDSFF